MKNSARHFFQGRRRTSALALAAIVLALCLPSAWRWLRDEGELAGRENGNSGSAIEARNVASIISSEGGKRVAEFAAERVEISADRVFATATNVTNGIIYRDGKPFLRLRASRVRFNQQTRDWEADGNLRASGPNAFTIRSQRAVWAHKNSELLCPGPVRATFRGSRISSMGAIYNAKDDTLKCPQPIEVRSQAATLQGTKAVARIKMRRVEFEGAVTITIHPRQITAP